MNGIRFVAALALICTTSLFGEEPSGDAPRELTAFDGTKTYVIEPPDVISIELPRPVPKAYHVGVFDLVSIRVANCAAPCRVGQQLYGFG